MVNEMHLRVNNGYSNLTAFSEELNPRNGKPKHIIAVDFDGVLHRYSRGWQKGEIYDEPVEGVKGALEKLTQNFELKLFTAREETESIIKWLEKHGLRKYFTHITNVKPVAELYVDDRALKFNNWTETVKEINERMKHLPKLKVGKSLRRRDEIFCIIKSQLGLFGEESREGETKPGKGGTLVLKKNPSGHGGHWELQDKNEGIGNRGMGYKGVGRTRILNCKKAYDMISGSLGARVDYVKEGKILDSGKFRLVNENNDGSLSLFLKTAKDGEQIIHISESQAIMRKQDDVIFHFKDKNIVIRIKEQPNKEFEPKTGKEVNPFKLILNPKKNLAAA
ncbi:MAG: hypothetical protein A2V66_07205 [Ignavibacteria bacterium RBG_13_36_8]|nr:MAG: hypothetical protein A2V66_07205 [Ignavibacteria bacterium RBG_13_36_8]